MNFCESTSAIWQFAGYVVFALKILIPLVIIILGVIDLSVAVVSSDNDAIFKATKRLARRLILGVVVFFIPGVISFVIDLIEPAAGFLTKIDACEECLLDAMDDTCDEYVETAKANRKSKNEEYQQTNVTTTSVNRCYYVDGTGFVWTNEGRVLRSEYKTEEECAQAQVKWEADIEEAKNRPATDTSSSSSSGSSSSSSGVNASKDAIVLIGDSRMLGVCTAMNITSKCYYGVGMGYDWLNGGYSGSVSDSINTQNPVTSTNDAIISGGPYNIVINLGVYDISNTSSYIAKYKNLAQNDWKGHNVIITSITPVSSSSTSVTQSDIDNFNNIMNSNITSSGISNLKFCNLGLTESSLSIEQDGLHYTSDGYKAVYQAILDKCL